MPALLPPRFWSTHRCLRYLNRLAMQRHPNLRGNRLTYVATMVGGFILVVYLFFVSVLLALFSPQVPQGGAGTLTIVLPFLLFIDTLMRMQLQQRTLVTIRPFLLLPIPRRALIDYAVWQSLTAWGQSVWLFFFVPYCLMAVLLPHGFFTMVLLLVFCWQLIMLSGQILALVRLLTLRSMLWWGLYFLLAALLSIPFFTHSFQSFYGGIGGSLSRGSWWLSLTPLPFLWLTLVIHRTLLLRSAVCEVQGRPPTAKAQEKQRERQIDTRTTLSNRWIYCKGSLGRWLFLEFCSVMRNKAVRGVYITAASQLVLMLGVLYLSDVYSGEDARGFWGFFVLLIFALSLLIHVPSYEANFLDWIALTPNGLSYLFRFKYYLHVFFVFLITLCLLPLVLLGHWTWGELISKSLYTMGVQLPFLMQMLVYNDKHLPLNERVTGLGLSGSSLGALVIVAGVLTLPWLGVMLLRFFLTSTSIAVLISLLGLIGVATHPWWLSHLTHRWLRRRYRHMERFREQ